MISGQLVDILHSEWMRLKTDMLPLWFYNCVTERARERASIHWRIRSSDVLPTATWTGMLKETVTDLLLTHISRLLEHINKLATTEQSPSSKKQLHEKTTIKGINKSHYYFMIYLGIKPYNQAVHPPYQPPSWITEFNVKCRTTNKHGKQSISWLNVWLEFAPNHI